MALTRNFLKAMGLNDEQINSVIEAHADTVDALKKERDDWKGKAATVETLTRERDEAVEKLSKAGDVQKVQKEFDDYKAGVERDKTNAKKSAALTAAFEQAGVKREAFRKAMLRGWDMDKVELDDNGVIKDMDGLKATVEKDYADFIATSEDKPLPSNNPPSGGGQKYTAADIEKMSTDEINKLWESGKGIPGITK
jgi:hypothetical protein